MKPKTKVRGKVIRHIPFGLVVWLPALRRKGIVRDHEISWQENERSQWRKKFAVGKTVDAIILDDRGKNLELSIRLFEKDPWNEQHYRKGQVVHGFVQSAGRHGVFVDLPDGIRGFMPHLPKWMKHDAADLFWPGDHIQTIIKDIDTEERKLTLEWFRPNIFASVGAPVSPSPLNTPLQNVPVSEDTVLPLAEHLVLIVEDDPDQAKVFDRWLQAFGQRTIVASSAEIALEKIHYHQPHIVMSDLHLPGMDGATLIKLACEQYPQINCVLMTDWAWEDRHEDLFIQLQALGVRVLLKPLLPEDIQDLLRPDGVAFAELRNADLFLSGGFSLNNSTIQTPRSGLSSEAVICALLERFREETGFESAVLFVLKREQRTIEILARKGKINQKQQSLSDLIYSPVRDVAEDDELVHIANLVFPEKEHANRLDVKEQAPNKKYQYLASVIQFASAIGVKVPNTQGDPMALFLFDHTPREKIFRDEIILARATALAISCEIEKQRFVQKTITMQKLTLLGIMSGGLVHEINHLLQKLIYSVSEAEYQYAQLVEQYNLQSPIEDKQTAGLTKELSNLTGLVKGIGNTTRMFGRILTNRREEILLLEEVIQDAIHLTSDLANTKHVSVQFQGSPALDVVRSQASMLEQILINVLINAIDHIELMAAPGDGQIKIQVEIPQSVEGIVMARILVTDNGPGIHKTLWNTIFDAGYTSRQDGNGLGLYICRNILNDLHGEIHIAESEIFGGTTFVISIPYKI